jgi:hypothetical protein
MVLLVMRSALLEAVELVAHFANQSTGTRRAGSFASTYGLMFTPNYTSTQRPWIIDTRCHSTGSSKHRLSLGFIGLYCRASLCVYEMRLGILLFVREDEQLRPVSDYRDLRTQLPPNWNTLGWPPLAPNVNCCADASSAGARLSSTSSSPWKYVSTIFSDFW